MKKQILKIQPRLPDTWPFNPEQLTQTACGFQSEISIASGEDSVNAKSLLAVLGFAPECSDTLYITTDGADEELALHTICNLLCNSNSITKIDERDKNFA